MKRIAALLVVFAGLLIFVPAAAQPPRATPYWASIASGRGVMLDWWAFPTLRPTEPAMKPGKIRKLSIVAAILAAGILGLAILHSLPDPASPLPVDAVFDLVSGM